MKNLLKWILKLVALLVVGAVVSVIATLAYMDFSLRSGKFSNVRMDAELAGAHDHAIESFVASEGFGLSGAFRR